MRTTGNVDAVVDEVLANPAFAKSVLEGFNSHDAVLLMRCADAIEKLSRLCPAIVRPYTELFLDYIGTIDQQEVQWHVAQILPRLHLSETQIPRAMQLLDSYYESPSAIVRANALEATLQLAAIDNRYASKAQQRLRTALTSDTPSLSARARKLSK